MENLANLTSFGSHVPLASHAHPWAGPTLVLPRGCTHPLALSQTRTQPPYNPSYTARTSGCINWIHHRMDWNLEINRHSIRCNLAKEIYELVRNPSLGYRHLVLSWIRLLNIESSGMLHPQAKARMSASEAGKAFAALQLPFLPAGD